jgi:hypothetical protein
MGSKNDLSGMRERQVVIEVSIPKREKSDGFIF